MIDLFAFDKFGSPPLKHGVTNPRSNTYTTLNFTHEFRHLFANNSFDHNFRTATGWVRKYVSPVLEFGVSISRTPDLRNIEQELRWSIPLFQYRPPAVAVSRSWEHVICSRDNDESAPTRDPSDKV